ncbi:hypothetical protein NPIL_585871 [Nephila pilipes]|uniref:CCHC-type domain-containing protein n=1 Tax=Nephila pilipes TaxID=299642 RepID=A0A8X6MIU2_NEPPI|nr:hypothetical protein NPIL_585871 [Nephila pilipes]
MRELFIDSWPKFIKANELAEKLDEYESVRTGHEIKNLQFTNYHNDPKNYSRTNPRSNNYNTNRFHSNKLEEKNPMNHKFNVRGGSTRLTDNSRTFNPATSNDRGEQRCFSCNKFGHVLRDCPFPCTLCGESGLTKK